MTAKAVRGFVIIGVAILQIVAFRYDWVPVLFAIWIAIVVGGLWLISVRLRFVHWIARTGRNIKDNYQAFRSGW